MSRKSRASTLTMSMVLVACAEANVPGDDDDVVVEPPVEGGVTYHEHIRPLIEENCLSCHVADGIGPYPLDEFAAVKAYAPSVVDAVTQERMPPWLPDPDCRQFEGQRILTPDQRTLFSQWMEHGLQEGDPADYVAPVSGQGLTPDIGTPSVTLPIPTPYVPNADRPDDYRCFVMEHDFTEETYLRTSNVLPDRQELVHHVILFLVTPQYVAQVEALDDADPGVGYPCFGGVGAGNSQPIAGWVPGSPITAGSEDAAIRIPAGSRVVMQMHYNLLAGAPTPDQSEIQLWFLDERPDFLLEARFFPFLGIDIPAGDANSYQTRDFYNNGATPWTIVSTSPHMHLLGKRLRTARIGTDGAEKECVIDVPSWDFNWQQGYVFRDNEILTVQPGEALRLECWYDNSAANQPVINGVQQEPTDVNWGEGTLDEMCLNTLVFIEPYFDLPEMTEVCQDFQPCYDGCMGGVFPMTGCALQCVASDGGCANCVFSGLISCTTDDCGPQASSMLQCFESCQGETGNCIGDRCTNQILSYDACAAPIVESGACDASVVGCNAAL